SPDSSLPSLHYFEMANLAAVFLLIVALVAAEYNEEAMKRSNAFGTMRFGKRALRLMESGDMTSLPRLTRAGASLGTMRFGKRSMASAEYEPEELDLFGGSKRSAALGTMRFGRR
ncbi:hypothetical protein PFISCL1PPCAC_26611, partial [Pristionchus fissidentatus]